MVAALHIRYPACDMPHARPNIILLVGEDTGLTLGCYGDPDARTPNLDRLASQGMRYTHAFSTSPVCAPSRAGLVTSRYPWSLGTHLMRSVVLHPPRLFTHELRDAGYYVNWWTKTDFNFDPDTTPGGATAWRDAQHDWTTELAHGTLPHKPFFLYWNLGVTHESTMWSHNFGSWAACDERKKLTPTLPAELRSDPASVRVPPYLPDTPETRQCLAWYYDALAIQDQHVGRVLAALDQSPYAQNTIVIYLTDHGRGQPREKRWCYEAGVHLPLIVRMPGQTRGEVSKTMVSWVDMAPTILSWAGIDAPEHYEGQVIGAGEPRKYAFSGRDRMDEAFDHVRTVRDARWRYIRNSFPAIPYAVRNAYMERMDTVQVLRRLRAEGRLEGDAALFMTDRKPAEELYDCDADPANVRNLAADPTHAGTLARLRDALDEHLAAVGDLGTVPEQELIARGLIKDQLNDYRSRVEPLPPEHRIGPERGPLDLLEARAL
jgi:N-sulfoglucosamine sulfohydrolase